jgi:hypothetical protein
VSGREVLGNSEVDQLDVVGVAVQCDAKAVVGLDITVNNVLFMGGGEAGADHSRHAGGAPPWQRTFALQEGVEIFTFQILHDDANLPVW